MIERFLTLLNEKSVSTSPLIKVFGDALIRDALELARSAGKLFTDFVGKLEHRDKVANAESEAHRGLCAGALTSFVRRMEEKEVCS